MSLVQTLIVIILVGVVWALIAKYVPLPPVVNTCLTILFVVVFVVLLLQIFGINIGHGVMRLSSTGAQIPM